MTTFTSLGVSEGLVAALAARGIKEPTAIQETLIPAAYAGENLIGVFSANEYLSRANLMKAYMKGTADPCLSPASARPHGSEGAHGAGTRPCTDP